MDDRIEFSNEDEPEIEMDRGIEFDNHTDEPKSFQESVETLTERSLHIFEDASQKLNNFQQQWSKIKEELNEDLQLQNANEEKICENFRFLQESMGNFMSMFNGNGKE